MPAAGPPALRSGAPGRRRRMSRTRPMGAEDYARIAARLEAERAAAAPVVRQLAAALDEHWDREIPPEWRQVGFVQELTAAAREALQRDAQATLTLAQFAIVVAGGLPAAAAYPEAIRIQAEAGAWKEVANAHRYRSEYEAALRALDVADGRLAGAAGLGHDRAVMRLTRALVLADQDQAGEALRLLAECLTDFDDYDDRRRIAQCLQLRGMIEQRATRFRERVVADQNALET